MVLTSDSKVRINMKDFLTDEEENYPFQGKITEYLFFRASFLAPFFMN
jgi:hypothetical protein